MKLADSLWMLWFLLVRWVAGGPESLSHPSLMPGHTGTTGHGVTPREGQYDCLRPSQKDFRDNRTGTFCGRMWDGLLCWDETPAGTSVTQNCPDHPDRDSTEKVTKYCAELGNWVQIGSTCQPASKNQLETEVPYYLKPATGVTGVNAETDGVVDKMIRENENKCSEKMRQDPPYNKSSHTGLFCSRNWDGWLCWDDTPAGTNASKSCPNYFGDFDPTEKATKYCEEDGEWFRHPVSLQIWTNYTLCTTIHEKRRGKLQMLENEHSCHQKMIRDPPFNKSERHCGRNWDGWLCWNDTPAGTLASQNCPDHLFNFDPMEKATKYCGENGQWFQHPESNKTWTNYTLCAGNTEERSKAATQLSGDTEVESAEEATVGPAGNPEQQEIVSKKILDSQYKCFEKMNRDVPYNKSGLHCSRNWDGWLCWDDTPAGIYTSQNCPNYFVDFDPTEKAAKYCGEDGQWFRHPDTNRTWSNYTLCNENTKAKLKSAYILFYMAIVGHALSIASLLISLAIFFYFRSLSCQRITLHKNLFCSFVLNSALTIIYLVAVVNNPPVVARNPVGCKVLHFLHMYMLGCNYFWMLCEGIYLHTLIVVAVFAEEQHLHWYYLLGWGFPLVPASIHAVARKKYFDDNCWMSVETHLLYAVHGPIMAALLVNLFFLLNIIRVLVTKLRDTHRAESNMYMKAVRATLILVPLLGIQFVICPWRPENRLAGEVYEYIMHILMHYQGLLVATIFCFFNGEVQATLKRQWMQYKTQLGQRRKDHCSMRSASYTATSITEEPAFMYHHDCNSEHLNGRRAEDSELVALKLGDMYA
uniref:Calcitonin gene-related peptide type 1 receptor n=2 Tax=Gasterosteus aculeatus TaxID=69293 RepID=A0AAQ4RLZ6_GASAC|nr:calcitonin gene-related peptide type 1 receptor [Gasterosteus aculeatus aculeatus]XP_040044788.1 calcitonin gene-related peptide type 1 receptor [Gasterosteus aculeatus aculeatus]FAA00374.1 TPA: calcitonin receptor [Gasterosteus aculeatus]